MPIYQNSETANCKTLFIDKFTTAQGVLQNQCNNSMVNLKQFKPKIVRHSKICKL